MKPSGWITAMGEPFTSLVLKIFKKCAGRSGCEVCREHMEEDCLFFPEMYRLHDLAQETCNPPNEKDLASLVDLCTLCGRCPCQDIRILVLKAKAARAQGKKKGIDRACETYRTGCFQGRLLYRMQCRISVSCSGQSSCGPAGTTRNSGVCPFPALLRHGGPSGI